jgi:hypothetical protein
MVCIAAANAGATSQDLKTGFLVGATPRHQQTGLMIGAMTSSLVIGLTTLYLHQTMQIGSQALPAPQATLMATLIKGLLAQDLPWGLVLAGVFITITLELCGIHSLSFAVGSTCPSRRRRPSSPAASCARWSSARLQARPAESDRARHALQLGPDRRRFAGRHPPTPSCAGGFIQDAEDSLGLSAFLHEGRAARSSASSCPAARCRALAALVAA